MLDQIKEDSTIRYTMAPGRSDTNLILTFLAADLLAHGLRCCGTVRINTERPDAGPDDMDVKVLSDGPTLRISQDLGPKARGCLLDPDALETGVGQAAANLSDRADLLIINKFEKHGAESCVLDLPRNDLWNSRGGALALPPAQTDPRTCRVGHAENRSLS